MGVWMGTGVSNVINAEEVKTQPVPAKPNNTPKRTKHQ
jgi:hypothetical protein